MLGALGCILCVQQTLTEEVSEETTISTPSGWQAGVLETHVLSTCCSRDVVPSAAVGVCGTGANATPTRVTCVDWMVQSMSVDGHNQISHECSHI